MGDYLVPLPFFYMEVKGTENYIFKDHCRPTQFEKATASYLEKPVLIFSFSALYCVY